MFSWNYWLSWLPGAKPYDPGKENDLKNIVHNLINAFNIFFNKNITLYNETQTLYEDELLIITATEKLGLKAKSNEDIIATIEIIDSNIQNDGGFFQMVERIYKKLTTIKSNPEKNSYEQDIFDFKTMIGKTIINGKLYITYDLNKEEIKLIFEICDKIKKYEIYGYIELKIKFKREILKFLKNCSYLISKINSIYENEDAIFYALIGMSAIKILKEGNYNFSTFLQWVDIIGKDKNFEQNVNTFFNQIQAFGANQYNQFQKPY